MSEIFVGLDIGTSKICTIVAEVKDNDVMRVIGIGIEPSLGIKKGGVVDMEEATRAISNSIDKAEQTSSLEINAAAVSFSSDNVEFHDHPGSTGITRQIVDQADIDRAWDDARAFSLNRNQKVIHVLNRGYTIDHQKGIQHPMNFRGHRLEVDASIITANETTLKNLEKCIEATGIHAQEFVLASFASAEEVLTDVERKEGVAVVDFGEGTTEIAIYKDGFPVYADVIPVGGANITSDIVHGLKVSSSQAQEIKLRHGCAMRALISNEETFPVKAIHDDVENNVNRRLLAHIIEARVVETFGIVNDLIKRAGFEDMLPAGIVLTGGTSSLMGIKEVAYQIFKMPIRLAKPTRLEGLSEGLDRPEFSTATGLIRWNANKYKKAMYREVEHSPKSEGEEKSFMDRLMIFLKRLLPIENEEQ